MLVDFVTRHRANRDVCRSTTRRTTRSTGARRRAARTRRTVTGRRGARLAEARRSRRQAGPESEDAASSDASAVRHREPEDLRGPAQTGEEDARRPGGHLDAARAAAVHASLPDATVLQLTSLGVSAREVDGVDLMQARAVDVVAAAFKQYPEHRGLILDNLLVALLKLPTTGRHLRRYMRPRGRRRVRAGDLGDADAVRADERDVHEAPSDDAKSRLESFPGDGAGGDSGYGPAFQWSHYFWKELLKGWHSARAQEIDIKALMQNLVSDLLTALNMPEWPVASLMLLSLCAQLLSSHGINSPEIRVRELAMDFLGQVAARIKEDTAACEGEDVDGSVRR